MPGKLVSWPAWQEFETPPKGVSEDTFTFSPKAKADVIAQYGEEALRKSWLKVCKDLEAVTERLSSLGSEAVPVLDMKEIRDGGLSDARRSELKSSGCCIVRGVIEKGEATSLFKKLKGFVAANKDSISSWPIESPAMLRLYNSPTQIAVRTHPNHILLQRTLNSLFHDESGETGPEPLSYTDAARIRPPGQAFLGLGPHIDAGSLCRWADPQYRQVYDNIFSGSPELHDAYDLNVRKDADQFLFKANAHSVVFRAFQGWTALTPTSAGCGTLMLYPEVSTVIAYVMLRPFFAPPENRDDIMDASKWTFDPKSSWLPGTMTDQSQRLSTSSHPHLRLQDCLAHIPPMNPGDTVWWHTDMCHAVDPEHQGDQDASVVYVAACPTTPRNKEYIKEQLQAALTGQGPPDCPNLVVDESKFKGYTGFDGVSEEGKIVLGFPLL
ncbi:hypothetical protein BKA56DRAFT_652287 [Ilyonectria sp. MPI-CAGE-AT-0026]|nr:hypothetical protein BKA56DRAFT_652287 [Ilyonectria sp. MPI-CAGE-AT-0026]